jgi:hypothetical protein
MMYASGFVRDTPALSTMEYEQINTAVATAHPSPERLAAARRADSPSQAMPPPTRRTPKTARGDSRSPKNSGAPTATKSGASPRATGYTTERSPWV